MHKLLLAAAIAMAAFTAPAVAHDNEPAHYHVGEVQPFRGLVCREQESAMFIYDTWMEVGIDLSQEVFKIFQTAGECKFLTGYFAFFIERLANGVAPYFNGNLKNVLVFSVSPNEGSDVVDFLVVWEDLAPEA